MENLSDYLSKRAAKEFTFKSSSKGFGKLSTSEKAEAIVYDMDNCPLKELNMSGNKYLENCYYELEMEKHTTDEIRKIILETVQNTKFLPRYLVAHVITNTNGFRTLGMNIPHFVVKYILNKLEEPKAVAVQEPIIVKTKAKSEEPKTASIQEPKAIKHIEAEIVEVTEPKEDKTIIIDSDFKETANNSESSNDKKSKDKTVNENDINDMLLNGTPEEKEQIKNLALNMLKEYFSNTEIGFSEDMLQGLSKVFVETIEQQLTTGDINIDKIMEYIKTIAKKEIANAGLSRKERNKVYKKLDKELKYVRQIILKELNVEEAHPADNETKNNTEQTTEKEPTKEVRQTVVNKQFTKDKKKYKNSSDTRQVNQTVVNKKFNEQPKQTTEEQGVPLNGRVKPIDILNRCNRGSANGMYY